MKSDSINFILQRQRPKMHRLFAITVNKPPPKKRKTTLS